MINGAVSVILFISVRAFAVNLIENDNSAVIGTVLGLVSGIALFLILTMTVQKKASATVALAYAGLTGAFTNTLFVMSGIFILYKDAYAQALGIAGDTVIDVILGVVSFNGIIEAAVAAILIAGVGMALIHVKPVKELKKKV